MTVDEEELLRRIEGLLTENKRLKERCAVAERVCLRLDRVILMVGLPQNDGKDRGIFADTMVKCDLFGAWSDWRIRE